MTYEMILTERRGHVELITLNRPQALNALNNQLMTEVMDALEAFDHNDNIGAMVISLPPGSTSPRRRFTATSPRKRRCTRG